MVTMMIVMQLTGARTHAEFMTDKTREHNTGGALLFYGLFLKKKKKEEKI